MKVLEIIMDVNNEVQVMHSAPLDACQLFGEEPDVVTVHVELEAGKQAAGCEAGIKLREI